MTVRVAMWSGPRNISTAMMRAWENRPDTVVVDEPFYAAYLARTGIDHPGRDAVVASQPTDPAEVIRGLRAPVDADVHYAKQMTHHLDDDDDLAWVADFRNVLLVRDPAEVVASYAGRQDSATAASCGERWTSRGRQGSKPVERSTASYQYLAQMPSVGRGPGGQESMASVYSTSSASQSRRNMRPGFSSTSRASMTGGVWPVCSVTQRKISSCCG